ncbi:MULTISPECIES: NUDIX domain-containing protein [Microcoleaceae]|uniref:NUDIX domain-containing protein n=1 Tax=Microcoleaceae TaxID=1892252 RepID=UPI00187F57C0|nr:NUDIX domain-containing protein [Tychonema sp. LEGE 06208]MBE9163687.1 NUDIX domain-containing protein [Tychonema sp. LEGE 06208]
MNIPKSIVRIFIMLPNGQIGVQLRDNIPGIASQGMVSTFGGGVDIGESPQQAAVREMEEETCLAIPDYTMEFIATFTHKKSQNDIKILQNNHLFLVRVSDCDQIEIKEGVGLVVLRKDIDFEKVNAGEGTQMAWKLLQEYLKLQTTHDLLATRKMKL